VTILKQDCGDTFIANYKEERVMRLVVLIVIATACATGLGAVMGFQRESQLQQWKTSTLQAAPSPSPIYNPYPPGILPDNLNSETERVLREIDVIEARAIARWRALPPPNLTGQPPTLQDTGTELVEKSDQVKSTVKRFTTPQQP